MPGGATTAMQGEWVKGPGAALFEAVQVALKTDRLPFVAENLGVITPEVEALREGLRLPGDGDPPVRVRQRPAGARFQAPQLPAKPRRLHRHARQRHDRGLVDRCEPATARGRTPSIEHEREHARRYLDLDGRDVHWEFIRAALASVADTAIVPVQDLLGLGSDARMNRPGTVSGNWRWRLVPGQLTRDTARKLAVMTETYDRA